MRPEAAAPLRLLTIAGSDSGGGAGIQADLKTFAAHGTFGMSAVTAITAQNTLEVRAVHPVPTDVVAAQIEAVFDDIGVDAVKIGMLADAELVRTVAAVLRRRRPRHVVLDPVMVSKSGASLLADTAVEDLVGELFPLASVLTPNLPEAQRLTGIELSGAPSRELRERAAHAVAEAAGGGPAVLIKGGHGAGDRIEDLLLSGDRLRVFEHSRIVGHGTHGTGCTLSSAIAARLARGDELERAVEGAIDYLRGALAHSRPLGAGHGPLDHLYGLFP